MPRTTKKQRAVKRTRQPSIPLEDVIRQVARLFDRRDLNYSQTAHVIKEVRKRLGLAPESKPENKIPEVVSWREAEKIIAKAYERSAIAGIVTKFLWLTMVRVSELASLRIADIHLDDGYAKIRSGKGSKDRLVVLPRDFAQELRSYLGKRRRGPVFLSQRRRAFTPRRVQQIVEDAAKSAKVQSHVTPHTLRRSMATSLLNRGAREEVDKALSDGTD